MRSAMSGSRRALAKAACSRATISGATPATACRPMVVATSKPGKPSSAAVGTSGSDAERFAVLMHSARKRPVLIACSTFGMPDHPD